MTDNFKVKVSDLVNFQPIEKITIHSLDLALYQAFITVNNKEKLIYGNNDRPLRSHNLTALRKQLNHLSIKEMELKQQSAYDEMIGVANEKTDNTLCVPLDTHIDI